MKENLAEKIQQAQEMVQQLSDQESRLSKQLNSARELLTRWDSRLVTLRELASEMGEEPVETVEPSLEASRFLNEEEADDLPMAREEGPS